jgi:serralysin
MAVTVTFEEGMPDNNTNWQDIFEPGDSSEAGDQYEGENVTSNSMTYMVEVNAVTYTVELTGTGFDAAFSPFPFFDQEIPIAGTVTGVDIEASGTDVLTITGLNVDLQQLFFYLFDSDTGNSSRNASGFDAVSLLLAGATTFTFDDAPAQDFNLNMGTGDGNDIFNFTGHVRSVFFDGSRGNDTYKGAKSASGDDTEHDTVDYSNAFDGFRGVMINAQTGKGTDPWGGLDKFSNIEQFRGTHFKDSFIGKNQTADGNLAAFYEERFVGYGGADTFNGGGGFDRIEYNREAERGGYNGIVADLSVVNSKGFAFITDSFGKIDKVKNIEQVFGTMNDDKIVGNNKGNYFQGFDGVDEFDGKGGFDAVAFWENTFVGGAGIRVDLADLTDLGFLADGFEVEDDGFGNLEQLTSIERIDGSHDNDVILGDANDNELNGDKGDDTLWGRGGDDGLNGDDGEDELDGGAGNDFMRGGADADTFIFSVAASAANSDNVDDFNAGDGDVIHVERTLFGLTGLSDGDPVTAAEFEDAPVATQTTTRIVWDSANDDLYYDPTGSVNGSADAVLIAHFNNNPTIVAGDIFAVDIP